MNRTIRGLGVLTLSCSALWLAVPEFLAACTAPPSDLYCPDGISCSVRYDEDGVLTIGSDVEVRCRILRPGSAAADLADAVLERTTVLASRPTLLEVDVREAGNGVDLEFFVPNDGADWAELTVRLDFGGGCGTHEEDLGAFTLRPGDPQ